MILEIPMVTGDLDSSDFLVILEVPMVTGDLDSSDSRGFHGYGRLRF